MPKVSADLKACQGWVAHNTVDPNGLRTFEPVEYVWTDQDLEGPDRRVPRPAAFSTLLGDPAADSRFASLYATADGPLCGAVSVTLPQAPGRGRRASATGELLEDVHVGLTSTRAGVAVP